MSVEDGAASGKEGSSALSAYTRRVPQRFRLQHLQGKQACHHHCATQCKQPTHDVKSLLLLLAQARFRTRSHRDPSCHDYLLR
jgi:hypothetical protein